MYKYTYEIVSGDKVVLLGTTVKAKSFKDAMSTIKKKKDVSELMDKKYGAQCLNVKKI